MAETQKRGSRPVWQDIRPARSQVVVPSRGGLHPPTPAPVPTPPAPKPVPGPVAPHTGHASQPVPSPIVSSRPVPPPQPETDIAPKRNQKKSPTLLIRAKGAGLVSGRFVRHHPKFSAIAAVVLVFLIGGPLLLGSLTKPRQQTAATSKDGAIQSTATTLTKGNPTFPTILPTGKTAASLGGWTRVSPASANPVYAYADTIGGVTISVSEQPLPDAFKSDPAPQVQELAANYNATDKITTSLGDAYVGTSKDAVQSTIFYSKNLLVLIKSQDKIDDASWKAYIGSLQ